MSLDNLFYYGKTESCAIFSRSKEGFIDLIDDESRYASASIGYGNNSFFSSSIILYLSGTDMNFALHIS